MDWISVDASLPEVGVEVEYKAEHWRYGSLVDKITGCGHFVCMNEAIGKPIFETPWSDSDECYENVTHWRAVKKPA